MKINFHISGSNYYIEADGLQYYLHSEGVNQDEKSANFGKPTSKFIGHYTKVVNAVSRAVQDQLGNSPDEISLSEFITRFEKASDSITQQIGKK